MNRCIDCNEQMGHKGNQGRCRDCDMDYIVECGRCPACGWWLTNGLLWRQQTHRHDGQLPLDGAVNAIAPPPRRPAGTGSIGYHRATSTWRFRTPGGAGQEFSGFLTREAAEMALDDALRGVPVRRRRRHQTALIVLRTTMRYALELAARLEIDFDQELRFMRATRARRNGT